MANRSRALAVMLSGSGRTLLNLQKEIEAGRLPAKIVLVIASKECQGAERARGLGLLTIVEPGVIPAERLGELLRDAGAEFVALAGYLRLVKIPAGFEGRMVNIHPALLPKYGGPGMHGHHVHEAVIAAGERESGCTVHYCDDQFDTGDIILQMRCPVLPGDTAETLAARVFELECEAYPEAIRRLLAGAGERNVKQYPIKGNPAGELYDRLIDLLASISTHCGLVHRPKLHDASVAKTFMDPRLAGISIRQLSEWPGTRLPKTETADVMLVPISKTVVEFLKTTVNALYAWRSPWALEDLFFIDSRINRVIFLSVTHETESYFIADNLDEEATYEIVDGFAYTPHECDNDVVAHLDRCMSFLNSH